MRVRQYYGAADVAARLEVAKIEAERLMLDCRYVVIGKRTIRIDELEMLRLEERHAKSARANHRAMAALAMLAISEDREPEPSPLAGWVYFVSAGGMVKIGFSTTPLRRLRDIRSLSPVSVRLARLIPGDMEDEARLHAKHGHLRSHGEWFHAKDTLKRYR